MVTFRLTKAVFIVLCSVLFYLLPDSIFDSQLTSSSYCIHQQLFGFACPGCGITRATYFLMHGSFSNAFVLNSAVVFVIPILIVEVIHCIYKYDAIFKVKYFLYFSFCIGLFIVYINRIPGL